MGGINLALRRDLGVEDSFSVEGTGFLVECCVFFTGESKLLSDQAAQVLAALPLVIHVLLFHVVVLSDFDLFYRGFGKLAVRGLFGTFS